MPFMLSVMMNFMLPRKLCGSMNGPNSQKQYGDSPSFLDQLQALDDKA